MLTHVPLQSARLGRSAADSYNLSVGKPRGCTTARRDYHAATMSHAPHDSDTGPSRTDLLMSSGSRWIVENMEPGVRVPPLPSYRRTSLGSTPDGSTPIYAPTCASCALLSALT